MHIISNFAHPTMLYKQTVITVYYFYDIVFTVGDAGNLPLVVLSVIIIFATIIAIIVIAYIIVRHKCKFTLLMYVLLLFTLLFHSLIDTFIKNSRYGIIRRHLNHQVYWSFLL